MSIQDIQAYLATHQLKKKADKVKAAERGTKDIAPALILFPAQGDDCKDELHAARWQRTPITKLKDWWPTHITERTPVFKSLPWKFLGAQHSIAGKTIELAHDRTRPMLLKHFMSENANIATKPKAEFKKLTDAGQVANITDDWWEGVATLQQVKEAFSNFSATWFFLWHWDCTPIIFYRIMAKYNWCSTAGDNSKTRVAILKDYFNTVMQINSDRAVNEECILDFDEHEEILKSRMQKENLEKLLPSAPKPQQAANNQKSFQKPAQGQKPASNQRQPSKRVFITSKSEATCHAWNDLSGRTCQNKPNHKTGGCTDSRGNDYAHKCNYETPGKPGICEKRHRLKDH